jgi:hypothetical protein
MRGGTPGDSKRKGIGNERLGLLLTNAAASVTDPSPANFKVFGGWIRSAKGL